MGRRFDPSCYCPVCGCMWGVGKHRCPTRTISAINGAHARDSDLEPSDLHQLTYTQRLADGYQTLNEAEED